MTHMLRAVRAITTTAAIGLAMFAISAGSAGAASCGGKNQDACAAWKSGPQCNSGLTKYKGKCRAWGKRNQKPWPAGRLGFRCNDKSLAPSPDGRKCVPCGHRSGQPACETARPGPRCFRYMEEIDGVCRRRGGNDELPYGGAGFDCKPGFNVGDNGRCQPCGDADELVCEPLREGPECKGDLEGYRGRCRAWGREGEPPWPASRPGFRCDKGLSPHEGTCRPCGGTGQPPCERMRAGQRCTAAYHQVGDNGLCEARGGEGQPAMTGPGFECRPGYNWERNESGDRICTRCGGLNQVVCEAMREGPLCDHTSLTAEIMERKCVPSPNHVSNPFTVRNRSDAPVYVTIHWAVNETELWIVGEDEIAAGTTSEFRIAGEYTCNPRKGQQGEGTDWGLSDLVDGERPRDTCEGQHFQVMFWDSKGKRVGWALENAAIGTFFYFATDWALGRATEPVTGGVLPIPGDIPDRLALFALDLWNDMRDPDGTLAGYGVHGWAWNVPQEQGWVVYWGRDARPDFGFSTRAHPDPDTLVHPCERDTAFTWATAVVDGEVVDGLSVRGDDMCSVRPRAGRVPPSALSDVHRRVLSSGPDSPRIRTPAAARTAESASWPDRRSP